VGSCLDEGNPTRRLTTAMKNLDGDHRNDGDKSSRNNGKDTGMAAGQSHSQDESTNARGNNLIVRDQASLVLE
jgi:hypothetical protein